MWLPCMSVTRLRPEMVMTLPSTRNKGVPSVSLMLKLSPERDMTFSFRTMVSLRCAMKVEKMPTGCGRAARAAMVDCVGN